MMATFGVGALFGAGLAATGPPWPSGRKVRLLVAVTGAEVCLVAASPWIGLLYVGLALAGLLSIWYISLANALVQLRTARSCAYKCAFCRYPVLAGDLNLMSLAAVERELTYLKETGVTHLLFWRR